MEEEGADSSSADDDQESACKCVYLSNINCDSCRNIINAIEYVSVYGAGFSLVGITLRSLVIQRKEDHWLNFGIF